MIPALSGPELERRVLVFIEDPAADDFDRLSIEIFRRQYRDNADYRKLVDSRGIDPGTVGAWKDIPAVSTVAFETLQLTCGPTRVVFRTSGTTRGAARRGEHHLVDTTVYEASLRRQFKVCVLPDRASIGIIAIMPGPDHAPDSSLAFMLAELIQAFGEPGSRFYVGPDGLDVTGLETALRGSERTGHPVALLGPVFGFVHLIDHLAGKGLRFRLPEGSRIMDTGGFKGLTREVSRDELLRLYGEFLGVGPSRVVSEYGMTELCSQFYDDPLGGMTGLHAGPHWVRTRIIDPVTNDDAEIGRPGLLRHVDLANVHSVIAVDTTDLGMFPPASTGRPGVFLLDGRLAGAAPRGCSIGVDEAIARSGMAPRNDA